jgi:hypothetical protein
MSTLGHKLMIAGVLSLVLCGLTWFVPVGSIVWSIYRMALLSFLGGLSVAFVLSYAYIEWHMRRLR